MASKNSCRLYQVWSALDIWMPLDYAFWCFFMIAGTDTSVRKPDSRQSYEIGSLITKRLNLMKINRVLFACESSDKSLRRTFSRYLRLTQDELVRFRRHISSNPPRCQACSQAAHYS